MSEASFDSAQFFTTSYMPEVHARNALDSFMSEVKKGCTGELLPYPIDSIVPPFETFKYRNNRYEDPSIKIDAPKSVPFKTTIIKVRFSENDGKLWSVGLYHVLSQLHSISKKITFELIAIKGRITFQIIAPEKSKLTVQKIFDGAFPNSIFEIEESDYLHAKLKEVYMTPLFTEIYYPNYPYYRNLYVSNDKQMSHFFSLFECLSTLTEKEMFYYRLTLQSAPKEWERNCLNLHHYENSIFSLYSELNEIENWYLPPEAESKSAIAVKTSQENSPFYAVQPLIAFWGEREKFDAIKATFKKFKFAGKSYNRISTNKIKKEIGKKKLYEYLENRSVFMHGHLLTKTESINFIPFPCEFSIANFKKILAVDDCNNIPNKFRDTGISLGYTENNDEIIDIKLPYDDIQYGFNLVGNIGFGKTNQLLNIMTDIVESTSPKYSLVTFYFHDFEFVKDFISRIPKNRLDDVILATPTIRGHVLCHNYVSKSKYISTNKKASNLSYAIENSSYNFGIDIEYIIKNLFQILVGSSESAFDHILDILEPSSSIGKIKRNEARRKTKNRMLLKFLDHIEQGKIESKKIQNKLQGFFDEEEISLMCSYTSKDLIDYNDIVENKKILIWYLGGLGDAGNTIASMEVSLLYQLFYNYGKLENRVKYPTVTVIDEAQRIKAKGVGDSVHENRKHGLSYILSTQTMNGLDPALYKAMDMISSMGFFQVPDNDARFLSKKTSGKISVDDIMRLPKYEMYLRLLDANSVFHCNTKEFKPLNNKNFEYVLKNSLNKYYMPENKIIKLRNDAEKKLLAGGRPKIETIEEKSILSKIISPFKK